MKHRKWTCLFLLLITSLLNAEQPDWTQMRNQMIEEIMRDMRQSSQYTGKDHLSDATLEAVGKVERHLFVPGAPIDDAYRNHPLPIGKGQTISQPFIVALMTELLEVDKSARVLELGTGSGYQAAVLAEIVAEVYSIEVVKDLADEAASRLKQLGYDNVKVKHGDGTLGWPQHAPFDGIVVTAAGIEIPDALIAQLKPGANLVIPLGGQYEVQYLMVIAKQADGTTVSRTTIPVRFVPITKPD